MGECVPPLTMPPEPPPPPPLSPPSPPPPPGGSMEPLPPRVVVGQGRVDQDATAVAEAVKHLSRAIELVDALDEPMRTDTEIQLQSVMVDKLKY